MTSRFIFVALALFLAGCHAHAHVDKRTNLALPILDSETHSLDSASN